MNRIGFDVGGTNIAAGVVDKNSRIIKRKSVPFRLGVTSKELASEIYSITMELTGGTDGLKDIESIGIAIPGSLDKKCEVVLNAFNLGLENAPLRADVQSLFTGIPMYLANDANAAALAELCGGAFMGCKTAMLVTLGTGVGGGLILNGRMFNGGLGNGVELGHFILAYGSGRHCSCGTEGCFETLCAAPALKKAGLSSLLTNKDNMIYHEANGDTSKVDAKLIIDCAKAGDMLALKLFDDYVDALSAGLASVINIIDPEVIAIGGGICNAGDFLFEPLREKTREKSFYKQSSIAHIVAATMGNDAGIVGAANLIANEGTLI